MSLIANNTRWVLFLSASGDAEPRHVLDLAFGLMCLEKSGVNIGDIDIYIDGANRTLIESFLKSGTASTFVLKYSKDFFSDQENNKHENLVMFVTGHGGPSGLDSANPITPYALLNSIKSSPGLKGAVVYLGQCYAGIFNYIGAGSKTLSGGGQDPNVIFMGATNLHESLSLPTSENLLSGLQNWPANIFLLFVFKWFLNPVDVDGDGKCTIMDSYKYAGTYSNSANKQIKAAAFPSTYQLQRTWEAAETAHSNGPTSATKAALQAAYTLFIKHLELMYTHQECWILNAIPSQKIER